MAWLQPVPAAGRLFSSVLGLLRWCGKEIRRFLVRGIFFFLGGYRLTDVSSSHHSLLGTHHRYHPDCCGDFLDCHRRYQGFYHDPRRTAFCWGSLVCILDGAIDHHGTLEMVIADVRGTFAPPSTTKPTVSPCLELIISIETTTGPVVV
jgi:hypothetical protein